MNEESGINCKVVLCLRGAKEGELEKSLDTINIKLSNLRSSIDFSGEGNQTVLVFNPEITGIALYDGGADAIVVIWGMRLSQLLQLLEIEKKEEEIPIISFKGNIFKQLNHYINFMKE